MNQMQIISIQVGLPQTYTDQTGIGSADSVWTTAYSKQPIRGPIWVGKENLTGDGHANTKNHGGVDKAGCVYPLEHYAFWQKEVDLQELGQGAFAENFTTRGLLETDVCIGDTFTFGEAVVQVSQPRPPCWKVARWLRVKDLAARMEQTGRTGWYLRVTKEGYAESGAPIVLVERSYQDWNIAAANEMLYGTGTDLNRMKALATCDLLAESWREKLSKKIARLESQHVTAAEVDH